MPKLNIHDVKAYAHPAGDFGISCYGEDKSHLVFKTWLKSMEEAEELVEKIKKRGYVDLEYWYHFERDDKDYNDVQSMIDNDTLPDGIVPGYRD